MRVPTIPASSITSTLPAAEAAVDRMVEINEQAGDGLCGDAGGGVELGRGPGRERRADHPVAGVLPRVAGGVERERLARPRGGDHHVDAVTTGGELHDQIDLLGQDSFGPKGRRVKGHDLVVDTATL